MTRGSYHHQRALSWGNRIRATIHFSRARPLVSFRRAMYNGALPTKSEWHHATKQTWKRKLVMLQSLPSRFSLFLLLGMALLGAALRHASAQQGSQPPAPKPAQQNPAQQKKDTRSDSKDQQKRAPNRQDSR